MLGPTACGSSAACRRWSASRPRAVRSQTSRVSGLSRLHLQLHSCPRSAARVDMAVLGRRPMRRGLRCAERHGTLSRVSMQSEPGGPDRTARAVARTEQRSRKSEPTCQSTKNTNHCVTARNHRPCADSTTSPVHNTPPHSPKAALTRCTSHQAHTTRTRKKGLTTVSACLRLPRLHIPQQERPMEADADAAHRGPNLAARASRRSASPGSDASMPPATSW